MNWIYKPTNILGGHHPVGKSPILCTESGGGGMPCMLDTFRSRKRLIAAWCKDHS